ncbi:MAG TPA: hypothetical protein VLF94_07875, partial [Chlamydiales bacterium]|nr:hypothetical protein [Chlamydiales bacterium]
MPSPIGRKLPSGPGAWRKPPEKDAAGHPAASATSAAAATVLQNVFPNGKANDDVVLNFNREVDALVASHDKPDCNKEIFTIHIQNPKTKTSRTFRVSAEVPTGTSYDNAKDMWRIAIARKLHLIGNRETAKATVYDNCISYEINGKEHTDGDAEVAAVCSAYVSGDNSALRAALPAFERTIPSSRAAAPLYNTNPAPFLRWHNNNCYMQDALQDLLANP